MNKITIVSCAIALMAGYVLADGGDDAAKEAAKAEAKARMYQKTGGIIEKPGVGKIAVVNCQSKFSDEAVEKKLRDFHQILRVDMTVIREAPVAAAEVLQRCGTLPDGISAALWLVDDAALPMSLMCAEEHWAMVNVAKVDTEKRFNRLFARGAIMAFGGGTSQYKGSPMQAISGVEGLDKIVSETVAVDNMASLRANLQQLGIEAPVRASYRKACQDGWAPTPVDDVQRAIWEEVQAEKERGPAVQRPIKRQGQPPRPPRRAK